ncbi:MAG: O-antigen ligase family protein, partial [Myxococcota bacterium]
AGLIGVWALVQCIPLPAQLLALLSPEHARLRAELAPLVGTTPAGPISLAPAQTTLAAVRWLGVAAASMACATTLRLTVAKHPHQMHKGAAHSNAQAEAGDTDSPPPNTDTLDRLADPLHQTAEHLTFVAAVALAATGVILVLIGLGQSMLGDGQHLLGFIRTNSNTLGLVSGTFVNPNHAGTYLAMATLASAGLAWDVQGRQRILAIAATVVCAMGLLLGASRGALFGFAAGTCVLTISILWKHRHTDARQARLSVLGGVMLLALPLLLATVASSLMGWDQRLYWELARDRTLDDLTTNNSKWKLILGALELTYRFPWTGVGADASAYTLPAVLQDMGSIRRYTFVESDLPELLATLGVPVAGLALGLATLTAWHLIAQPSKTSTPPWSTTALGLGAALSAYVVHSGGSFNIFILGLALPAIAIAEVLLVRRQPTGWWRLPVRTATVAIGVALLGAALGTWLHTSATWVQRDFQALVDSPSPPPTMALQATQHTLYQLPMDGHTMGMAALLLRRAFPTPLQGEQPNPSEYMCDGEAHPRKATTETGKTSQDDPTGIVVLDDSERYCIYPLKLAQRGTLLAPSSPLAHLAHARLLAPTQPLEAAGAYRRYLEQQQVPSMVILPEILSSLPEANVWAMAIPPQKGVLTQVYQMLSAQRRSVVLMELATELQAQHPTHPEAFIFAIRAALFAQQPLLAELYGQNMIATLPNNPQGYLLTVRAMLLQKRAVAALRVLDRGVNATGHTQLRLKRVGHILRLPAKDRPEGSDALIDADLAQLRTNTLGKPSQRALVFHLSGLRWKERGYPKRAQRDFERATRLKASHTSPKRKASP